MLSHSMLRPASLVLLSTALLSGCALQQGLQQAVLMDYDQVLNMRAYRFQSPIQWAPSASETGIVGHAQDVNGFWLTYVVCNLRNAGSKAQTFHLKLDQFYVEFEGKKFFHQPLTPYTFSSLPNAIPANPQATALVNEKFRVETQIGQDQEIYQPSPTTQGGNPHRFAIFVTKSEPGEVDISGRVALRYEGYPNILNPRNQEPATKDANNPAVKADLRLACRAQLQ